MVRSLLAFALLACAGIAGAELPVPQAVQQLCSQLCHIQIQDRTHDPLAHGSGAIVAERNGRTWVLTAQHVVACRGAGGVSVTLFPGSPRQRDVPARVICTDEAYDLALLEIEPCGIEPLPVRNAEPSPGESLFMAGFPGAAAVGIPRVEPALALGGDEGVRGCWEAHGIGKPGLSGGPVLDPAGRMAGMVVRSNWKRREAIDPPLTAFVTAPHIARLLSLPVHRLRYEEIANENGIAHVRIQVPLGLLADAVFAARATVDVPRLTHAQTGQTLGRQETHAASWPTTRAEARVENGSAWIDLHVSGKPDYAVEAVWRLELLNSDRAVRFCVSRSTMLDLPAGKTGFVQSGRRKKRP